MKKNTLDEWKKSIDDALQSVDCSSVNKANLLHDLLISAPEEQRVELLRHMAMSFETSESNDEIEIKQSDFEDYITTDETSELSDNYSKVIDAIIDMLISRNVTENEYYSSILDIMTNNPLFPDRKIRVFFLYWFLIDVRTPYFCLKQGKRIADKEWKEALNSTTVSRMKIRFILAQDDYFKQKSEQASLIIDELDKHKDNDKVAIMVYIIHYFKNKIDRVIEMTSEAR